MRTTRLQQRVLGALAALATLAFAPGSREAQAQFQSTPTLFSGQATAVKGQVLGIPVVLVDTGTVAPEGGKLEAHLLCYPGESDCTLGLPDLTDGAVNAEVLNATVIAQGNDSRARASVADVAFNMAGVRVSATFVEANASAQCSDGRASVSAESQLVNLTIDGMPIVVTGAVNQTVELPGGSVVIINEQIASANGNNGNMTVRALHIKIPAPIPGTGDTDIVIAEAHADIQCGQKICPADRNFVTGGGWFDQPRKNFAVAGGFKNGEFWGHLLYIDHDNNMRTKVKGTGVTAYSGEGTQRHIEGTYEINGQPGQGKYEADVDDQGEPGRDDKFKLTLNRAVVAEGTLQGGNIQLHTCR